MCKTSTCVLMMILLVGCSTCLAQVDYSTATLKGRIFDPQQLAVSGATVTITSPSTAWTRVVRTGGDGSYIAPLLSPGAYVVRVEAIGFSTVFGAVSVSVGEIVNYRNPRNPRNPGTDGIFPNYRYGSSAYDFTRSLASPSV
ncbi:MAG: carboxypeptidase-like regulatory domain-containing protein [Terriglobia bacterium]|nr:carboxypeptidase-like regulatory domain-containing protein [Terriglobia bacterium]